MGQPEWVYYLGLVSITIAAFAIFTLPVLLSSAFILILLVAAFGLSITLVAAVAVFAVLVGLVALLLPFWPLYCCCYFLFCRKKSNNSTKPFVPKKEQSLPPKRKTSIREPPKAVERKPTLKKSPNKAADRSQIGLVEDHYTKNTLVTISDEEDEKPFKTLPNKKQEVIKKSDPDQSVLRTERLRLQAVTDDNE